MIGNNYLVVFFSKIELSYSLFSLIRQPLLRQTAPLKLSNQL